MTDTDNLSRRRFLKGTGAAATAAALAGCTGGDGDGTDTSTATSTTSGGDGTSTSEPEIDTSKTVRSTGSTMDTLDPIKSTDTASGKVIQDIFDALTNYPNGQVNVQNLLAESVETSNDGATMTFKLKEGVTYSNGDEVTASDVVYSFERLAGSPNTRRSGFILSTLGVTHETEENDEGNEVYVPGSLGVEATGDYTVEINLEGAFYAATTMLAYSAFSIIPEGIVADIESVDEGQMEYQEFATSNPIGTGPYTLENWEQSTEVRLAARDEWHGGEIRNSGVHYAVFQETNPAYTYATVNVNADGPVIPAAQYQPDLRSFEGTDDRGRRYGTYGPIPANDLTAGYYEAATLSTYYLGFNCASVPKPVRQAASWVVNQEVVANQIIPTPAKQAYFFTPPALFAGGPDQYTERKEDYPYGYQAGPIEEAKAVMEEAGYGPDNRFSMTFDMSSGLASSWGGDLFTLMRDKLTQAYIDIEQTTADWSTYLNRLRNGNSNMYIIGWIADYPGIDNFLQLIAPQYTDTSADTFYSYFNWSSETGDEAQRATEGWNKIQNNYGSGDAAAQARAEAGLEMELAAWNDAVYVPLYHGIEQGYSYQWTHSPRFGAMGPSRQKSNSTGISDRGEYE